MLRALSILATVIILSLWPWPIRSSAQSPIALVHNADGLTTFFNENDLCALRQNQTVVKLLPAQDKREVAVCGMTSIQAPSDIFLQSFRESMVRKSDPAILEIGRFSSTPTIDDLRDLTLDARDIDDLRQCVAGDCKLKLSAAMIERFQKEIDWAAADYRLQATQLFKQILLDYVREYLRRGDSALIQYDDKPNSVRLAEETRSLVAASSIAENISSGLNRSGSSRPVTIVEDAIVWSKIKFGLKPVTAISHIVIYKQSQTTAPQIVVVSKQLYANHYFDGSLAVTAFGSLPGENAGSYLVYENRSRIDGLTGVFGKLKREVIEKQAVDNLKTILEKSQASLNARTSIQPTLELNRKSVWEKWTVGALKLILLTGLISALLVMLILGNQESKKILRAKKGLSHSARS